MLQGFVRSKNQRILQGDVEFAGVAEVGAYAIVGCGSKIGQRVIIDRMCQIDQDVVIGDDVLVIYQARIGAGCRIGSNCVIGGILCEDTHVGEGAQVFGRLVHRHLDPAQSWDHRAEFDRGPKIDRGAFVGHESLLIGDILIGERSYVCGGAIVTRDVPPKHIAYGVNNIVHHNEWPGELSESPFFRE